MAAVARLQAQAFHEASLFAPLDSLLYYVFQASTHAHTLDSLLRLRRRSEGLLQRVHARGAHSCGEGGMAPCRQGEVLAGLQQKMKYSHSDGFCCLVASTAADPGRIVGVVEVSLQGERVPGFTRLAVLRMRHSENICVYLSGRWVLGEVVAQGEACCHACCSKRMQAPPTWLHLLQLVWQLLPPED